MKVKWYWRPWRRAEFGSTDLGRFFVWSPAICCKPSGDKLAGKGGKNYGTGVFNWLRKNLYWRECVVLEPFNGSDSQFIIGFYGEGEKYCWLAPLSAVRRVSDGPFAMRLGPEPCYFFVVGTALIDLVEIDRVTRGTPEDSAAADIVIY